MSRFGPTDPFYVAMLQAEHDERTRRVLALDVRYGCFARALSVTPPIVDRDPGDEDGTP